MASTYSRLPVSIPSLMRAIVTDVETNLVSETSLDIPRVSFKCETWIKLMERLTKESQVLSTDVEKYPLVALIRNFDEKFKSDTDRVDVSLTLVIVTPSTPTKESEDREVDNYTPILYPIYAELMQVIKDSNYFEGYQIELAHTKTDNMHLGVDGSQGSTKYLLPDCVDGIIISDLKLTVVPSLCVGFNYGPTVSLTYINNVSELAVTYSAGTMSVRLVSVHNTVIGTTYNLVVPGVADSQSITVGGTKTFSLELTADGFYHGYISCDDAQTESKLYFIFTKEAGNVIDYTLTSKFILNNFIVTGLQYTDYPYDVVHRHIFTKPHIEYESIADESGNVVYEQEYLPGVTDTTLLTTTITQPLPSANALVSNTIIANGTQVESESFYKTTLN